MKKILIVEDEHDIVTLLSFSLKKAGFEIITTRDGEKGLAAARDRKPDLIILDLNLPKLPGEEVCKAIREDLDESFASTPIIMVTAKAGDVDRIIGKSIGANRYITKPFEMECLLKEIRDILHSRESL